MSPYVFNTNTGKVTTSSLYSQWIGANVTAGQEPVHQAVYVSLKKIGACKARSTISQARLDEDMGFARGPFGSYYSEFANLLTPLTCAHTLRLHMFRQMHGASNVQTSAQRQIRRGRGGRKGQGSIISLQWERKGGSATKEQGKEKTSMTG